MSRFWWGGFFDRLYISFHLAPAQETNKILPKLERIQTTKFTIKHNKITPAVSLQQEDGVKIFGLGFFPEF